MKIVAHRGNIDGKSKLENSFGHLYKACQAGYGIEVDLRLANGKLVVSHDDTEYHSSIDASHIKQIISSFNPFITINIKQFGISDHIAKLFHTRNGFVFDFELINTDCLNEIEKYRALGFKIARRHSDIAVPLDFKADYIWLDEMHKSNSVNIAGMPLHKIFYVSPELHGRPIHERRTEFFGGVCTDYAEKY